MKWITPFLGLIACGSITQTYAACDLVNTPYNYKASPWNITKYEADSKSESIRGGEAIFNKCSPSLNTRAVFNPADGELQGNSPFGVNFRLNESGLSPETTAWLQQNLEISFNFKDASPNARKIDILSTQQDFAILPGSPVVGNSKNINGIEYYLGAANTGIGTFGLLLNELKTNLKFVSSPSLNVINELNKKPFRIKIGELKVDIIENGKEINHQHITRPMYIELKLNIKIPTCTMKDVVVDLGQTTVNKLLDKKVSNVKKFDVEFTCEAIPKSSIYARITDSFNPNNINDQGILYNNPGLKDNAAQNVAVQLLTDGDQPLNIGSRAVFTPTDKTNAPTYHTKLKAQLYHTGSNPTAGYVNAQATVLLDYE